MQEIETLTPYPFPQILSAAQDTQNKESAELLRFCVVGMVSCDKPSHSHK